FHVTGVQTCALPIYDFHSFTFWIYCSKNFSNSSSFASLISPALNRSHLSAQKYGPNCFSRCFLNLSAKSLLWCAQRWCLLQSGMRFLYTPLPPWLRNTMWCISIFGLPHTAHVSPNASIARWYSFLLIEPL